MQKAYRYRLYPTDEQTQMMTRIIGCCRFVYNRLLEYSSKSYKRRGESHTSFDLNNFICHTLKKAYPWLSDAPAQTLQCVSADLSAAFKSFFRKDASYPKYKSKHRSKKSSNPSSGRMLPTRSTSPSTARRRASGYLRGERSIRKATGSMSKESAG